MTIPSTKKHSPISRRLSPREKAKFARAACARYLRCFAVAFNREYVIARHIFRIEDAIERYPNLIITAPPRHGKSELISRLLPPKYFASNPKGSVIFATYGQDLATDFGRKVRDLMESEKYQGMYPDSAVSQDSSAAARFHTNAGGSYFAVGVGGPITGRGGDLLIGDDLFKNRQDADSPIIRERTWNWFTSTFLTRRSPTARTILINTRWHPDDVTGRLLRDHAEDWHHLHLPAIDDTGVPLWPERFSLEKLLEQKRMNAYEFEALYQGRPTLREGAIVKRADIQFYKELPAELRNFTLSADLTFKDAKSSDFTAIHCWAMQGPRRYLIDRIHGRMSFTGALKAFRAMAYKYPQARRKLVEEAANGAALIDTLKGELDGIIPVKPRESKYARLQDAATLFEAHNVFLPDPSIAPWVSDVVEETCGFPSALHDDDVDAMTQYLNDSKINQAALNALDRLATM